MGEADSHEDRVQADSEVESHHAPDRQRSNLFWLTGLAAIVALIALVDYGGGRGSVLKVTEPTADPAASISAARSPTTTSTTAPVQHLEGILPDNRGELIVAISGRMDLELVRWPVGSVRRTMDIPMVPGPVLEFDSWGRDLAFLGRSASGDGLTLYVGTTDRWAPARVGVSSFAWHVTTPGRLAWMHEGDRPLLCWADVFEPAGLGIAPTLGDPFCVSGAGQELVGFDGVGFLSVDHDSGLVHRLDGSGSEIASLPGTDALIGPEGRILIVDRDEDGFGASFSMADPDLTAVVSLDWAPENSSGEYGFVAWSGESAASDLAFLTVPEGEPPRWDLEVWSSDGVLKNRVTLRGRVWDVSWDSTGRYVLVAGVVDESDDLVQVYDTFSESLAAIRYDDWVQDANLITPLVCEDATHVAVALASRLPDGVSLSNPQMVLSRDAHLESWYFMSAILFGDVWDGLVATWALPGFNGQSADGVNTPNLAVPANEEAEAMGFGMMQLDPSKSGVNDWMAFDGARASQHCVQPD